MQFRNVEREPMNCKMALNQLCHKEDRCSIPAGSVISLLTSAEQRGEVLLQGFGGVLSPCFLLKITSQPFILLQGRPFTHRGYFSSSLLKPVCIHCCAAHHRNIVTFQAGVMSSDAVVCSLLFPLGQMMGTAALGHQLPLAELPLTPVLSSACMALLPGQGRGDAHAQVRAQWCETDTK